MMFAVLAIGSSFVFGTGVHNKVKMPDPAIQTQIQVIAKSMGETPRYYIEVAQKESNTNPLATNKYSTSLGLYQFIDGTWKEVVDQYGEAYDLTMNGRTDVRQSVVAAILFTRDNAEYLRNKLDREPTTKELYIAHFAGPRMAVKIIKAHPGKPIVDVMGQRAVNANPHIKGKTVGGAIQAITKGIS